MLVLTLSKRGVIVVTDRETGKTLRIMLNQKDSKSVSQVSLVIDAPNGDKGYHISREWEDKPDAG